MASLHKESDILVGNGILHPQQKNRWRMQITDSVPIIDEARELIQAQIIKFKFSHHLQTLEMVIEQNMNNNHLHTLVKQLSKLSKLNKYDNINFIIEELDGCNVVTGRFIFNSCKMLDQEYVLDYADGSACAHRMQFSFKKSQDLT